MRLLKPEVARERLPMERALGFDALSINIHVMAGLAQNREVSV